MDTYPGDTSSGTWQRFSATILAVISYVVLAFQAAFVIWGGLLLVEFVQVSTKLFTGLYVIIQLVLVVVWWIAHNHFVSSYDPLVRSSPQHKVTSTDLARIRSVLYVMASSVVILGSSVIGFLVVYPGDITREDLTGKTGYPVDNDGHAIRDGMDTSSPYYTLWLMLLFSILMTGVYLASNIVYAATIYTEKFVKGSFKPKGN